MTKLSPSIASSRNQVRALIVDDDPYQLELISEVLRALGVLNVTTTPSVEKALRLLSVERSRINLILLDLHMPGMDGFAFMDAAAKIGFGGGLILVSDQAEDVLHAGALVAKLRRFSLLGSVPKPVEMSALSLLLPSSQT